MDPKDRKKIQFSVPAPPSQLDPRQVEMVRGSRPIRVAPSARIPRAAQLFCWTAPGSRPGTPQGGKFAGDSKQLFPRPLSPSWAGGFRQWASGDSPLVGLPSWPLQSPARLDLFPRGPSYRGGTPRGRTQFRRLGLSFQLHGLVDHSFTL